MDYRMNQEEKMWKKVISSKCSITNTSDKDKGHQKKTLMKNNPNTMQLDIFIYNT